MQARRKSEETNMSAKKNRNREWEEQRNGGEEWRRINEEGSVEWRSGKERVG